MAMFLQVLVAVLAAWAAWWLIRKMLRLQAPVEPAEEPFAEDPFAEVSAPRKHGPKGLAGAVALEEPEDSDPADAFPPRSL